LAILVLSVAVASQIEGSGDLQRSLTITTLVLVLVGMPLYVFTFRTSKERVHRDVEKATLRQTVTTLRQNRPLLLLGVSSVLSLFGMFSLQTVAIYYARDVQKSAGRRIPAA
jgi:glucuronide carrier protein